MQNVVTVRGWLGTAEAGRQDKTTGKPAWTPPIGGACGR